MSEAPAAIERWLPVVGFEGRYEVSDLGRVRSLDRTVTRVDPRIGREVERRVKGCVLQPGLASNGYLTVSIAGSTHCVHELVLRAFVGPPPEGMECRHRDGVKRNVALTNLQWGTRKENAKDRIEHGTVVRGSAFASTRLTESDAIEIRRLHRLVPQSELAQRYGVSPAAIQAIHDGRTWRHAK